MEKQQMFPKEFKCPFCGVVLELEDDETHAPQIYCASCQKEINVVDLEELVESNVNIEHRFETLVTTGKITSFIGWIITGIGLLALLVGLLYLAQGDSATVTLISGVIGVITGIMWIAIGQSISCFVAIEENTRKTAVLLAREK
ncbi:MAG: hypothetical protein COT43_08455 [Candidatus Marinimicrobia bacterium CG08_land_8_20_14_0_20_45_22]|nr:MAG: hypothetical protein COT43_08455 [Candidatus Marinimicrobia bacterium CG08_land_8_20_14_0_20_45_22]